jgi:hypothetical protein
VTSQCSHFHFLESDSRCFPHYSCFPPLQLRPPLKLLPPLQLLPRCSRELQTTEVASERYSQLQLRLQAAARSSDCGVRHFGLLLSRYLRENDECLWMQSGEFFISADPPSLSLPSKSLNSAAKYREWGSGEHFRLLLRRRRRKKGRHLLDAVCGTFWATFAAVLTRK